MRKRCLSVTFLLALVLLFAGVFAGCENCVHEYGEWETISAATCEKKGEKERVCKKCGKVETADIAALEHLFDEKFSIDVAPTEESEGVRSRHCLHEGCNAKTDEQKIAKLSGESEEQTPQTPQNPQNPNKDEETEPQTPQNPSEDEEQEPQTPQKPDKDEEQTPVTPQNPEKEEEQTPVTPQNPDKSEEQIPQTPQPQKPAPQLGDIITYRVYVNRWNGYKFYYDSPDDDPKISIYDSTGKQVFSDVIGIRYGVALNDKQEYFMRDIPLPMGEYTIKIDKVAEGFIHEDSYAISYLDGTSPYDTEDKYPTVDIRLGCDMDKGGETLEVDK